MAVGLIGQQDYAVGESGIDLRQRDHHPVAVSRFHQQTARKPFAAQGIAEGYTRLFQHQPQRNPFEPNTFAVIVDGYLLVGQGSDSGRRKLDAHTRIILHRNLLSVSGASKRGPSQHD